jgi:hypothetical protein
MNKCMQEFQAKYGHVNGTLAHVAFFASIANNPGNNWFSKLRTTASDMEKAIKVASGVMINENKSPPLYTPQYMDMQDHFCRTNTPEAFTNASIMSGTRLVWGRASEVGTLAWEDFTLDNSAGQSRIVMNVFQVKVSELKPVPFLPAYDNPLLCPFVAAGDAAIVGANNLLNPLNTPLRHRVFSSIRGEPAVQITVSI